MVQKNGAVLENPWVGGINGVQVSKIDLNNDSIKDIFLFDRTGDKILTYVFDTTINEYKHKPEYEENFPNLRDWVLLRDYDCDGKADIFSYVRGGIGVWKNTSTSNEISFTPVTDPYVFSLLSGNILSNLYVSDTDIPDVNDIDGDGDLDVLTFSIFGERIEYHKNMSIENGYGCDSLVFEQKNNCWGHFIESGFGTNICTLFDTCAPNVSNPEGTTSNSGEIVKSGLHSGSTVLSLDLNNDGVRDLLLGDVSFDNVVALYNDNTGVNQNTSMVLQETSFPSGTQPVDLHFFPGCFYEDIDQDGVEDLIVSPNDENDIENTESVWYYKNYGTSDSAIFAHIKDNFLQDEMIEVGTSSYPVLFDYNNDGLLDLFVSNFGYFDQSLPNNYYSQIALYENVGTTAAPDFQWTTDDFAGLSLLGFTTALFPSFGDIDNDNDIDLLIGDYNGNLHLLKNSSNSLNTMTLTLTDPQLTDGNATVIDVGYSAKPALFDLDGDLDLDLVIGEENGNLNYYENVGNQTNFSFREQSSAFGGIELSEWFTTVGNSIPTLFKNSNGHIQLFVGSERGALYHYNGIDGNLLGAFNLVDSVVSNINIGPNCAPAIGLLNHDTLLDLIIGTKRGGLGLYYGTSDSSVGIESSRNKAPITIYPNPTNDILHISGLNNLNSSTFTIYDLSGRTVLTQKAAKSIHLTTLARGTYLLSIFSEKESHSYKFIKQ